MACIMKAPSITADLSCASVLTAKRHVELSPPTTALACRNTFSVSHASKHPCAAVAKCFLDERIPQQREDMDAQRSAIRQHQQAKRREITEASERRNAVGTSETVIGLKCLMRHAAEHSIRHAHVLQYHPTVISFMRQTWQWLLQQVQTYLSGPDTSEIAEAEAQLADRCREALENISALGVWFSGAMSIPFRRYSVCAPAKDGTLQDFVLVGLASFTYSSHVMDDRRLAQEATLAELERLSKRLGVSLLFLPPLVLPEEPLRENCGCTHTEDSA
ncbi:hypothetical protein TraAM80_07602 [Trypanosoma rangeli]|uniref:Uncharacterized protein n=1 Tax=Trypanosoma rangeli TaxID=5698 RepID=A0A3R7LNK0_TRYRA|nr:uncharacterized protein TraAM80_07602 [Trypanosoma rangeli]RNF00409.1 hypothetical protein TraAM80_07602 [Trypanosoma rangeli]|eukprot:RNF00409.1 hypothetical protein TraAM80_07602 [Trypanosoma rangeli]